MIIVSQDKKRIVNFDNLTQVYITHCEEDNTGYFIRFETVDSLYEDLGEYATEERAKEILRMIVSAYQSCKLFQCANNATQEEMAKKYQEFSMTPFKFEMPQE